MGRNYDCCSACSDNIVEAYKANGWEFVKRALNEKGYVDEISGLKEVRDAPPPPFCSLLVLTSRKVQRQAEAAADDVEWDDDGEELEIV